MHLFHVSNEILICVLRVSFVMNLYIISIHTIDVLNICTKYIAKCGLIIFFDAYEYSSDVVLYRKVFYECD